jgi:hypothetical protein
MKAIRIALLAALFAGASAVLAGPAYADELDGTYAATATGADGSSNTATWVLTSCGPDCRTLVWGSSVEDMHRQGTVWTSTDNDGCTTTLDENSLSGSFACAGKASVSVQAVKVG